MPDHKAWAELVAVPATSVFALPADMSYLDAAAITMNYTVAYILLFELANLTPGKSLLLHSAGGGVVSIFFSFPNHFHSRRISMISKSLRFSNSQNFVEKKNFIRMLIFYFSMFIFKEIPFFIPCPKTSEKQNLMIEKNFCVE